MDERPLDFQPVTSVPSVAGLGTVYIRTWGCQMNEYDSQKMLDILRHKCRLLPVDQPDQADLILMNTCSVREKAQEKVFSELGRYRKIKSKRPQVIIGVGGCVASQEGDLLRERAPWVDIVFGPQTLHRLPDLIDHVRDKKQAVTDISFPKVEKFDELILPEGGQTSAFVSIMEGCSKYCSFCVVPYTRGREVSRSYAGIVAEISHLADLGYREVTLLGQNVNAWQGYDEANRPVDFAWLIKLIDGIEGIERIRYTTSHPLEMTDRLIQAHETVAKLMPFLHLPVQAGADRVLARMKRGYTVLEYKAIIRKLRQHCPDISLSSDFIVAFPGESDAEHGATMKLVEDIGFDHSYSFIYSPRPGTPASSLPDQVDLKIAKQRLQQLQDLLKEQSRASRAKLYGQQTQLLIDDACEATEAGQVWRGRTPCNRAVRVHSPLNLSRQLVQVVVKSSTKDGLVGELVQSPSDK